jgi:hypothetical protein
MAAASDGLKRTTGKVTTLMHGNHNNNSNKGTLNLNRTNSLQLLLRQLIPPPHFDSNCTTGELLSNFRDIYGIQGFFTQVLLNKIEEVSSNYRQ